jgi:hypothetical protein
VNPELFPLPRDWPPSPLLSGQFAPQDALFGFRQAGVLGPAQLPEQPLPVQRDAGCAGVGFADGEDKDSILHRDLMIEEAKKQHAAGSIITLMWRVVRHSQDGEKPVGVGVVYGLVGSVRSGTGGRGAEGAIYLFADPRVLSRGDPLPK